jgi:hypothetical protein
VLEIPPGVVLYTILYRLPVCRKSSDTLSEPNRTDALAEMVPQLLSHLGISHVAIASHSGGVIYAMNTVLEYPGLLHPKTPYIAFFAPWVHHSHTGVTHLKATELLPAPLIGRFASLVRFLNNNVIPLGGLGTCIVHGLKESLHHSHPGPAPVPLTPTNTLSRAASITSSCQQALLDLDDPAIVEELRRLITEYLFAERIDGISEDAKLFLKKPSSLQWCSSNITWSDFDQAAPLLLKLVKAEADQTRGPREWLVDAFHAQADNMVGDRGRKWFDNCWKPPSDKISPERNGQQRARPNCLEYESQVVHGSEHNYLMDPAYGAAEKWLASVRDSFPSQEEV